MARSRKLVLVALLTLILVSSFFVYMKVDFDNRSAERLFLSVIKSSPACVQAFQKLGELTPVDAVILSWWDYGLAIQELGKRKAVVAYPSRDIIESVGGVSRDQIYGLEMQLFGTFESSEKIHDVAKAFVLPEDESLPIMRKYGATHVMVFYGTEKQGSFYDPWKFLWIAKIAGYNGTEYIYTETLPSGMTFKLTPKADKATMLRLAYDEDYHPQHFTKIYENEVAKIYRIDYPTSTLVETSILSFISSGPNAATLLSTALHPHDENLRRYGPA